MHHIGRQRISGTSASAAAAGSLRGYRLLRLVGLLTLSLLAACGAEPETGGGQEVSIEPLAFRGGAGSGQPHFARAADGKLVMSWLEPAGEGTSLRYASYVDGAWSSPDEIVRSDQLFVNWADFPSVNPITDDIWLAHWLQLKPDAFGAYDAMFSVSTNGGASWSQAQKLNDDDTETEHGFVRVFPLTGGIGAVWLDGRELADWSFDNPDVLLGVSLRFARFDANGAIVERDIIDELVCDCCQPDVAISEAGPIIVYRDRTEDEIRDIVARRLEDGEWLAPVELGGEQWHIEGCPVNGPAVAADGSRVVAAWFTAADGRGRVRAARSDDGGRSFAPAFDVDVDGAYGQVDVELARDGHAVISWWRRSPAGGIDLVLRTVGARGELGEVRNVAHNDESQPIDVPQMAWTIDGLVLAWTTLQESGAVRTALVRGVLDP